jgi:hypothetical protein
MKTFALALLILVAPWFSASAVDLSFQTEVERYTLLDDERARHESGYMTKSGGMRVVTSYVAPLFGDMYYELLPVSGRPVMNATLFDSYKAAGLIPNLVRSENSYFIGFADYVIVSTPSGPDPNPKPSFLIQPEGDTVVAGGKIDLYAHAEPFGEVSLQWLKNGKPVVGATSTSLTISNCSKADAGKYSVVASIGGSKTESTKVVVKVIDRVAFRRDLADVSTPAGKTVSLSVAAKGAGKMTYEWYHNGLLVQYGRSARLILRKVKPSDAGNYYVIADDGFSWAFSTVVNVAVSP